MRPTLLGQSGYVKDTSARNKVRVFWLKDQTIGLVQAPTEIWVPDPLITNHKNSTPLGINALPTGLILD